MIVISPHAYLSEFFGRAFYVTMVFVVMAYAFVKVSMVIVRLFLYLVLTSKLPKEMNPLVGEELYKFFHKKTFYAIMAMLLLISFVTS